MKNIINEIFIGLNRPKPGKSLSFKRAANLLSEIPSNPEILEIGCRCDLHSIDLAYYFGGHIYSVNSRKEYLDELKEQALKHGYADIIECVKSDLYHLDFPDNKFNIVWLEETIHNIGFERGIGEWKKYLNHFGYIAINDISWLKNHKPLELKEFWNREYPEMNFVDNNLKFIESAGYKIVDYFVISPNTWWDEYYEPLDKRINDIRYTYIENEIAQEIFDYIQLEIDMFKDYSDYYGNVYYIMQMPN